MKNRLLHGGVMKESRRTSEGENRGASIKLLEILQVRESWCMIV